MKLTIKGSRTTGYGRLYENDGREIDGGNFTKIESYIRDKNMLSIIGNFSKSMANF